MEEKKKNSLLPLIIVLTLVLVLSVGGVYAYFSARAANSGQTITGQTLNINGSTLTIAATRLNLSPSPEPVSDNLVPAYYGVEPEEMTTTAVNRALSKACVVGGYTGCHVWKIVASTTQNVQNANILLSLSLANVDDEDEWSYVVYTGTDSSSTSILNSGSITNDFPNNGTIDIHNNAALTTSGVTYYVMVYLNNENAAQNDGVTNNTTDARGTYNGTVTLEAMGGEVHVNFLDNAAEYITNLYTSATKSTATVNNITYNLAPSVNLMNDRHASMSTDINGGDIRYYGRNPNNYVWLGDTYTSDYTISGGVSGNSAFESVEDCLSSGYYDEAYCTDDTVRHAGDKKLWRIIGVFDGQLKLISNDPITNTALAWDTSVSSVNGGSGINQWGESTHSDTGVVYEGADLMRLLNPGYENESVNNSLYWTKGTGTVYAGNGNATISNVSFADTGLSSYEKNMIDQTTIYFGASSEADNYVSVQYALERQDGHLGKECSSGSYCNDKVVRTATWEGKVGLMYLSDYGYGADLSQCNQTLNNYYLCRLNNWLYVSWGGQYTISPSTAAYHIFYINEKGKPSNTGTSGNIFVYNGSLVTLRSTVYLKPGVTINTDGKDGSEEHPYILNY